MSTMSDGKFQGNSVWKSALPGSASLEERLSEIISTKLVGKMLSGELISEEDKHATTSVQNGFVFFFLFSFINFSSL